VSHRVRERPLKQLLGRDAFKRCAAFKMARQLFYGFMKPSNLSPKIRERLLIVLATYKESPSIAQHTLHVPYEFERRSDFRSNAKGIERLGSAAQCLLRAISQSREKVAKE